jgi:hypothetical protein
MNRRPGRSLAWIALLGAALAGLRLAATGDLATPPLTSLDDLQTWVDVRGPVPTAIGLVRLLAEAAAWYLLALSTLHVLAGALRFGTGHAVADALALPGARRLVHAALGLSLVAAGPAPEHDDPDPAIVTAAGHDVGTTARIEDQGSAGTAAMRPFEAAESTGTATMTPLAPPRAWPVQPGESFWTIAADILTHAWGRPVSDHEIDPFWRSLVAANRDRLLDPADPDLIVPGQVFDIPPVPPAP